MSWASGVLFSGRSSWFDLTALTSKNRQTLHPRVLVETKLAAIATIHYMIAKPLRVMRTTNQSNIPKMAKRLISAGFPIDG
jgi:hypothetical protein